MTLHTLPHSPGHNSRRKPWLTALLLVGVLSIVAYVGKMYFSTAEQEKPLKPNKPPVAVLVESAKQEAIPVYLNALGTVTGLRTVTVRPRLDGELIKVAFQEGQMVQVGDLLAEIDARALKVQLLQVQGQLTRDQALLSNAKTDLARYQTLLAQDSISAQQAATQAALVKQYQGSVAIDQALVANAKLQLSYARITAPISGRVGLRLIDQGNMVHVNDANGIAVITQLQPIAVVFSLPEDQLPALQRQLRAGKHLAVDAYDRSGFHKLAEGRVFAIDNQIDLATGTVKLKSQFENKDGALFANQFVNIKLLLDTLQAVTTIPATAIQNGTDGSFVYVVQQDQHVKVRPVTLGPAYAERVVIMTGLSPGELAVVDGADKLRDGAPIKLITREHPLNKSGSGADGKAIKDRQLPVGAM